MNCDDALDLVIDSLMDNLDENANRELRDHLSGCERCEEAAAQLQRAWSELGRLREAAVQRADGRASRPANLRSPAPSRWTALRHAAAALALLASGVFLGRVGMWHRPGRLADGPAQNYLLLIRGDEPERRAPEAQLVSEYSEWAAELARRGALIFAEKLTSDAGRWVQGVAAGGNTDVISGFFLVRATDYDEAEQMALASPHIAYGGTIELRAIAATGGSS